MIYAIYRSSFIIHYSKKERQFVILKKNCGLPFLFCEKRLLLHLNFKKLTIHAKIKEVVRRKKTL